jgi:parallel beta-helix repeat protein
MGPVNVHYRIDDNLITDVPGIGILIASSRDAIVSNNTLTNINLKSFGDSRFADVAIYVTQSDDIKIQGNHFRGRVSIDQSTTSNVAQAE